MNDDGFITGFAMKTPAGSDFLIVWLPEHDVSDLKTRFKWQCYFSAEFAFPVVLARRAQDSHSHTWTIVGETALKQQVSPLNLDQLAWQKIPVRNSGADEDNEP